MWKKSKDLSEMELNNAISEYSETLNRGQRNKTMIAATNEDNMLMMARYPDDYFDLAIVDPPYGINAEHGTNRASRKMFKDKKTGWDSSVPNEIYFKELMRVSKNQIIWGGNYFLNYLGSTRSFIIWDKLNPDRNFADCELAWCSFDRVARIFNNKKSSRNE